MKLISSVLVLCLFLFSGYGYAQKEVTDFTSGVKQLEELVGKIVIFETSSKKIVGEVTKIKKDDIYIKRSKEKWVGNYIKANKANGVKAAPRKEDLNYFSFPDRKVYILEEGKEQELFMNGMDLLSKMYFQYFTFDKVKIAGQEYPVEANSFSFEDDKIKITWDMGLNSSNSLAQLGFEIQNKTSETVKLIWDETTFVDKKGEVHKVFHSGIKYIDRNNPLSPSMMPGETKYSDIIIPTDYVFFSSEWYTMPLYSTWCNDEVTTTPAEPDTMRVILALQIGENKVNYNCYFKGEKKTLDQWPKELQKIICNRVED